eukprot:4453256-Prymnesium_polylepis.2
MEAARIALEWLRVEVVVKGDGHVRLGPNGDAELRKGRVAAVVAVGQPASTPRTAHGRRQASRLKRLRCPAHSDERCGLRRARGACAHAATECACVRAR